MRILSLGAGVQSSTLAMMAEHEELPKLDAAIFADTGWEPKSVYTQLEWLKKNVSFPIYTVSAGNLKNDLISANNTTGQRFSAVPFFTEKGGIGRRQCTSEYKIIPVQKKIRELMGYKPRKHVKGVCELWIGISLDEIQRMKPSQKKWIKHEFPLIENRITRMDCMEWFRDNGYPEPVKSSCLGCPFHSNQMWQELKDYSPEEFEDAVYMDKIIRNGGSKMEYKQYMHKNLKPLSEIDFVGNDHADLFGNECDGFCNT